MSVPLFLGVVAGAEDVRPIDPSTLLYAFHPSTVEPALQRSMGLSAFVSSRKAVCSPAQSRAFLSHPKRT